MWLFAPEKLGKKGEILEPVKTEKYNKKSLIKKASELSVLLRKVYIHKSFDPPEKISDRLRRRDGTTNDLLLVTEYQAGKAPNVQRFHKFMMNRKARKVEGPFNQSVVCSFSDFNEQFLILKPRIYDSDRYDNIIKGIDQVSPLLEKSAGIFPVFGSSVIKTGMPIVKALFQLIDTLDTDEQIIDQSLRLYVEGKSAFKGGAFDLLQTGHYVCFSQDPDEKHEHKLIEERDKLKLRLTQGREILDKNNKRYTKCSYVIYSIIKEAVSESKEEIDQKTATLLSELNGTGNNPTKSAVDFLSETLDGYNTLIKLKRVNELTDELTDKTKKQSDEKKNLLEKLQKDKKIKSVIDGIIKTQSPKPKNVRHKPLRDFVKDVTKKMSADVKQLKKEYKLGEMNHRQYEKKLKKLQNQHAITRKIMKEQTAKYYSNKERNEAFRKALPKY